MIIKRDNKGRILGNPKFKSTCKICNEDIWDYRQRNVCSFPKKCLSILRSNNWKNNNPAKLSEVRNILKIKQTGKNNNQWNGGKVKVYSHASQNKTNHYIKVKMSTHPFSDIQGYIMQHRLVMEAYIGRYLNKEEIIHHINGNKSDNRIENLLITNNHEHLQYHSQLRKI